MKLSDAIMLNGMTKPQGFGSKSIGSTESPCAIGGALQAIGKQVSWVDGPSEIKNYQNFTKEWTWTSSSVRCPQCGDKCTAMFTIWHLNDVHHWTRQHIAEWVSRVEPQDPEQTIEELVETAEVVND